MTEKEAEDKTQELIALLNELREKEASARRNIESLQAIIKAAIENRQKIYSEAKKLGIIHPELCQHWVVRANGHGAICCRCGAKTSILDPVKT